MKKILITIICVVQILSMMSNVAFASNVVLASNDAEKLSEDTLLELLALSEIVYQIPSQTFFSLSADDNCTIISDTSVKVIELNGNGKKASLTITPADRPISNNQAFTNFPLKYTISLYNQSGKKVKIGNSKNNASLYKKTITFKSSNYQVKSNEAIAQWMVHYNTFNISLPTVNKKTKLYLVVEPSNRDVVANIEATNSSVVAPDNGDLKLINKEIYDDYFEIIYPNTKITSSKFIDRIHPGEMYLSNNKPVYWKTLIKNKLTDYIYAENNEDANITGNGFFAATFLNEKTKTAVIVYRGSNDLHDWTENNIPAALSTRKVVQMQLANKYYNYICSKYNNYNIMLTGHSLGGGLANSVTFEHIGEEKSVSYIPGGRTEINHGEPISVGFNASTAHMVDSYDADVNDPQVNYINIVTSKSDIANNLATGNLQSIYNHIHYHSYAPDELKNLIITESYAVHGLAGLVMYKDGKFSLTPWYKYLD